MGLLVDRAGEILKLNSMQTDGREISYSADQLRKALRIREQIEELQAQMAGVLGRDAGASPQPIRARRRMSLAARRKIAAAQKARWAERSPSVTKEAQAPAPKRRMSAGRRAKLAAAARVRWAKAKAEGRTRL